MITLSYSAMYLRDKIHWKLDHPIFYQKVESNPLTASDNPYPDITFSSEVLTEFEFHFDFKGSVSASQEVESMVKGLLEEVDNSYLPQSIKPLMEKAFRKEIQKYYKVNTGAEKHELNNASRQLPGIKQQVEYPCECRCRHRQLHSDGTVRMNRTELGIVIMHLNDTHRWPREKIADWMDELADSGEIDIDFPAPDEVDFDREAVNKKGLGSEWKKVGYITDECGLAVGQDLTFFKEFKVQEKSQIFIKTKKVKSLEAKLKEEE